MKNTTRIGVALAISGLLCGGVPPQAANAQGTAPDFTRYVTLGDSLTAGYQDGSLYDGNTAPTPTAAGQRSGYVVHVAGSMRTTMVQPYLTYPGATSTGLLVLNPAGPCVVGNFSIVAPQAFTRTNPQVPANDVGVPGQSMVTAVTTKWSIDPNNPATIDRLEDIILGLPFVFAGAQPMSQLETAVALQPTFVSVWLGNNDALGAAVGADAALLTPNATFKTHAETVFNTLGNVKGVAALVPDVTVIPHIISQPQLKAIIAAGGGTLDDAQIALVLGVKKTDYIPMSALTSVQRILGGQQTGTLAANQILTKKEVKKIRKAVKQYNAEIRSEANQNGWAIVDAGAILADLQRNGLTVPGVGRLTTSYLGGIFSLDGVHPSVSGYAVIADAFVQAINAKYGTDLARIDIAAAAANDPLRRCIASAKAPEEMTLDDYVALMPAIQGGADAFLGRISK